MALLARSGCVIQGTRRQKKGGEKETAMIKKEKGRLGSLQALAPTSLERNVDRHGRRRGEISRSELPEVPGARHPRLSLAASARHLTASCIYSLSCMLV